VQKDFCNNICQQRTPVQVLGSFCAAGGFQVPLMIDGDFASGQYIRIISINLPVASSPIARRLLAGKE
jgi:hypothetical protein